MFWNKKKNIRSREESVEIADLMLRALIAQDSIGRIEALNIPTLAGCVELISNTIASLPLKLCQIVEGKVSVIEDDYRLRFFNDDTKDTLDAFQFKKAMIEDYLLMGNAYAYINKERGKIKSIHYVKEREISVNMNTDPIFKNYELLVGGLNYKPYEFIKVLRNTTNGADGQGIVEANNKILTVIYNSLMYENILAKTGGNKKGFVTSENKLSEEAIKTLKEQWKNLYSNNSENCVVLNKGLAFQESSSTSTEMQLNENKKTNGIEVFKILNVPPSMLEGDGKATEDDYEKYVKLAILPVLKAFTTALNREVLLEKEKSNTYFVFDIKELLKGDIEKRFKAYEIAIKNGFLGVNEVRYEEDREPIDAFDGVIKLGLNDVLFNTKDNSIYTPNTDKTSKIDNLKGGD